MAIRESPNSLLDRADGLIRAGQAEPARELLGSLLGAKNLSDRALARAASLLKRAGDPYGALKTLSTQIRHDSGPSPSKREIWLEYADALSALGASGMATRILADRALAGLTKTKLYRGVAFMRRWDYAEAERELGVFLSDREISDYDSWVARVNRCAAWIVLGRLEEAEDELAQMRPELEARGHFRLLANAFELQAQAAIARESFAEAERAIAETEGLALRMYGTIDAIYVENWRAIALFQRDREQGLSAMQALRAKCAGPSRAEMRRSLDARIAEATSDSDLLARLWRGTPHARFRANLPEPPPGAWFALISRDDEPRDPRATRGRRLENWIAEFEGGLTFRAFAALLADSYRRPNVVELFERVYPDSYFNPIGSPLMVHQLLHRARKSLASAGAEATIEFARGEFAVAPLARAATIAIETTDPFWRSLERGRSRFQLARAERTLPALPGGFTARDFARSTGKPLRTAQLALRELVAQGALATAGRARAIRYFSRLHGDFTSDGDDDGDLEIAQKT